METFNLPDVGEGLTEAEITEWKVAVGDTVAVNDVLCEIETAKSLVDLPSPYAGTVAELMVPVGETVAVGTPIIGITTGAEAPPSGGDGSAAVEQEIPDARMPAPADGADTQDEDDDDPAPRPGVGEEAPVPADGGVPRATAGAGPAGGSGAALTGSGPKADSTRRRPRTGATPAPSGQTATPAAAGQATAPAALGHQLRPAPSPVPASSAAPSPQPAPAPRPAAQAGRGLKLPAAVGNWVAAGRERQAEAAGLFERVLAKPPVRRIAKELGVDLTQVRATGQFGEVTRTDVENYLAERETNIETSGSFWMPDSGDNERRTERIRVKGVRKATAAAVTESYRDAPHVSIYVDVDASRTMEFVKRLKASREFEGIKVTPLLILAKAVIWAAARNPHVNASWTDEEILVKHYMNLGIAAATPRGLLVPNIKNANELSLRELAMALTELAKRARDGKTQPAEMADGTISITNIGALGIDTGTPIINRGEVAIVAFGTIRQKPWVVSGEVIPRWITTLGGSFDHRVVDGDLSARFMADVAAIMEEPALLLE
ncbi:dihydrolipoamide acetyltransferase family protein [Micrococcus sp. TA1]|uniref:dihydrolipoamide acetyltransferase family protein n=1 Tax=Micrococcus sp. TA1 TaxID=681627 RepID=UPI00160A2795|nr:dihydrolipoamide acetyltransferase family protein [Micrococcus sp. TA1]MBB5750250.1 pyruvate dehydrogenase E2 component (dihydrolipoamide acetyltransferase) [Micrococcus sp. TA1]